MTANRIIQHIFREPSLPMVSEAALEDMVSEYPYFTAARLLLAQKHYDRYLNLHAPAIKKAQLYSNNPHYFYQFITGELEKTSEPAVTSLIDSPFTATTYTPADPTPLVDLDIPALTEQPAADSTVEDSIVEDGIENSVENSMDAMPPADETTAVPSEIVAGTGITPGIADEIESVVDEWAEEPAADTGNASSEFEAVVDDWGKTVTPDTAATASAAEPEDGWEDDDAQPQAADAEEEPLRIFPMDTPKEETTLSFQPLYTDDYFAYKKLKEPEQADELSEKGAAEMRSFTDWLREMKQDFAQKANKDWYHQQLSRSYVDTDPEVSETVEKMAMESITLNDDIVSETLAEIWARQRQYQTAIQIYQKLSLLNPGKSTYFAQKIQELQALQLQSENK